jgi:hypothetical protein
MRLTIDNFRTRSGLNVREHHMVRARRVKEERALVGWHIRPHPKPATPCTVVLTRIAPSGGLDPFDNLPSSMKGVADAVAEWLGIDDKRSDLVKYEVKQERGPWAVRIEVLE